MSEPVAVHPLAIRLFSLFVFKSAESSPNPSSISSPNESSSFYIRLVCFTSCTPLGPWASSYFVKVAVLVEVLEATMGQGMTSIDESKSRSSVR